MIKTNRGQIISAAKYCEILQSHLGFIYHLIIASYVMYLHRKFVRNATEINIKYLHRAIFFGPLAVVEKSIEISSTPRTLARLFSCAAAFMFPCSLQLCRNLCLSLMINSKLQTWRKCLLNCLSSTTLKVRNSRNGQITWSSVFIFDFSTESFSHACMHEFNR